MHVPFRPIALEPLARWIFQDLDAGRPVLGLPLSALARPGSRLGTRLFGRPLAAPLGVAAGPHTQLAQNIVAAWLAGARFIELKTVQVLDDIQVARPCIDPRDEGYNCEWSQELSLEQSATEYLNAWVLVHALAHRLGFGFPGALFALSVGYDLKGIQSPKVQRFLSRMRDASAELPAAVDAVARVYPGVRDIDIPSPVSLSVTLSTMHGCPPKDIEQIARYLLSSGLHTWVKLNPTLLGPQRLRSILNERLGWDIRVPDLAFDHDPRFDDALAMVKSLRDAARGGPAEFGIKLSNTLEVENRGPALPASEKMMYMSGRALHPLTLTLAHELTEALDASVPVSFCGGADAFNFPALVRDGLSPVTVCTDLLKPGGYARLGQYLSNLEQAMDDAGAGSVAAFASDARSSLAAHAREVAGKPEWTARTRPVATKGRRELGFFDCVAAPCREACPSHQNIPGYLRLVAAERPAEALDLILQTNAMPGVTGSVCDHPCTSACVRTHYDAPLSIREVKRHAVEQAGRGAEKVPSGAPLKVAVVGAGPAGLAAAWFLARSGARVTVLDANPAPGGLTWSAIPAFRLTAQALGADIERIRSVGVELVSGTRVSSVASLRARGFDAVVLALGAQAGKKLGIPGEQTPGVYDALDFLGRLRRGEQPDLGRKVLVVGGGNSAMDAARTAKRLVGDGSVSLVYRRTRAEMPADENEVAAALQEGVGLLELVAPSRVVAESGRVSGLACRRMKLGEPDASGRRRPVPADDVEALIACDSIITAISQEPVLDAASDLVLERSGDGTLRVNAATGETSVPGVFAGGDVVRGPSSIIQAVADGRRIAAELCRRNGLPLPPDPDSVSVRGVDELLGARSRRLPAPTLPHLPPELRKGFDEVEQGLSPAAAQVEASRCLDCDTICSLCVTVCPNRANHAYVIQPLRMELPVYTVRGGALHADATTLFEVRQQVQTLNVADFCNECGNCVAFCPTAGRPWSDKPRFHVSREGFEAADGDAFRFERTQGGIGLEAKLGGVRHRLKVESAGLRWSNGSVEVLLRHRTHDVVEARLVRPVADGETIDLAPLGTLVTLLGAAEAVPG